MPWKGEKDPYKIWLSEIILQQTRVEQGLAYYQRFIQAFPSVEALAGADETDVFKLWEGLGYYTRCKNLVATAKIIAHSLQGRFPSTYESILGLKGIGPYTAAAISSFAFNLPHAVLDGNVFRVLARYFGISTPIDSKAGKELFFRLSNELLDRKYPGIYNQAIMDFGAIICKPQVPLCTSCIMNNHCTAFRENIVQQLPVKEKSIARKSRWFVYLVLECRNKFYVRKRGPGDIWENLHEFISIETEGPILHDNILSFIRSANIHEDRPFELLHVSETYRQLLTHQIVSAQFFHLKIEQPVQITGYELLSESAIRKLPFPKFTRNYLKDKNVSLNSFHTKKNQPLIELITII